jgi:hypothetical protein
MIRLIERFHLDDGCAVLLPIQSVPGFFPGE